MKTFKIISVFPYFLHKKEVKLLSLGIKKNKFFCSALVFS